MNGKHTGKSQEQKVTEGLIHTHSTTPQSCSLITFPVQ